MKGFRSLDGVERGGKPRLTFNPLKAINSTNPVLLPCNHCVGCRADRVEQWGTRCYHESQMHSQSAFITLTFNDDHLPDDYSVNLRTFQLFMKRLREEVSPFPIRFFGCGEYGDENLRPHYHALIFGYDFSGDRKLYTQTKDGPLYTSDQLAKVWPYGFSTTAAVTPKTANYCAGYIRKKIGGDLADQHYTRLHPKGYVVKVEPEFATQSRRPGLGATWFDKYHLDAFPSDFLIVDGQHKPVPLFYFRKLQELEAKKLKRARTAKRVKVKDNATKERLAVREHIKLDRVSRLKRTL